MNESNGRQYSLYRLLFVRLLIVLVPLALVTLLIAYKATLHYTNEAFDRSLARRVYALADQVEVVHGKVTVDLPKRAHDILEFDPTDVFYFRVLGPSGELLSGTQELTLPEKLAKKATPGRLAFFDSEIDDKDVRVAAFLLSMAGTSARGNVLIMAGETTEKRHSVADDVLLTVFLPMMLAIGGMVYIVSRTLNLSLRPVNAIREAIASRGTHDLEPIEIPGLPAEIRPLLLEMNRMMGDLRSLHESRQRFLADSAHQLRTPLASMRAQTELAMREARDEAVRDKLGNLLASLDRQSRLVSQLLALSRAENALADPIRHQVRLDGVARQVTSEWVPRALEREIDIGFVAPETAQYINCNSHPLSEALANLLDNALRYCGKGGTVTVKVFQKEQQACVTVSDSGPGVPDEALNNLFERFYRLPGSAGEGCGLGLAIVRQVALTYEGQVQAANRPEGGLEVSMCFPKVESPQ